METKWTPEQQKEHRKLWVEALRSGKYQQTTDFLRTGIGPLVGFCCLGIACEVSGLGTWDGNTYVTPSSESEGSLQPELMDWLGLKGAEGEYWSTDEEQTSLARLNDHEGKTFAEIADIIESEPPGLVVNV